jgi:Spy/CpxP family protein refolding chaperone
MILATQILLLAALAAGGGVSGKAHRAEAGTGRKANEEQLRDQIFDQMRADRMWKLTDALKLDEATAARVFPLLSKYDDQERTLGQDRAQAFRELRQAIEAAAPDGARINTLVDRLIALRARRQALGTEKTRELRKMLTPVQMAKLMIITPRLEEGFRQRIHDAIDGQRDESPAHTDRNPTHRP